MNDTEFRTGMKLWAEAAVKNAKRYGRQLDYSEASVEVVSEILDEIAGPGTIDASTPEIEEQLWVIAKMYGAYLGEVICRCMDGTWEFKSLPDGGVHAVIVYQNVRFQPLDRVYRRLTEDPYAAIYGTLRFLRYLADQPRSTD